MIHLTIYIIRTKDSHSSESPSLGKSIKKIFNEHNTMSLPNQSGFIERIKSEVSATIDAIHNHKYIHSLDKHEIKKEKLEIFICEQYHLAYHIPITFAVLRYNILYS